MPEIITYPLSIRTAGELDDEGPFEVKSKNFIIHVNPELYMPATLVR